MYEYLENLDNFTIKLSNQYRNYLHEGSNQQEVFLKSGFTIQGVYIPVNTRGQVISFTQDYIIIRWLDFKYSAWTHFHYWLLEYSNQLSRNLYNPENNHIIYHLLDFIHNLLVHFPLLAVELQKLIPSTLPSWVSLFFTILTNLSYQLQSQLSDNNDISEIISLAIYCIIDFAHTHPHDVWSRMNPSNSSSNPSLQSSTSTSTNNPIQQSVCHTMLQLLVNYEIPSGHFSITLAFLSLLKILLLFSQRWFLISTNSGRNNPSTPANKGKRADGVSDSVERIDDNISSQFEMYLYYVRNYILTSYNNWRYMKLLERWKIGIVVMEILELVLTDDHQIKSIASATSTIASEPQNAKDIASNLTLKLSLSDTKNENVNQFEENDGGYKSKEILLNSLLHDSSFHNVILSIISIGSNSLDKLRTSRRPISEIHIIENQIIGGFKVLEQLLIESEYSGKSGESSFEHAIMSYSIGKENTNFILLITSYILYQYNQVLPILATRTLTLLCKLSLQLHTTVSIGTSDFNQKRPSLVAYLGSQASELCKHIVYLLRNNNSINESLHIEILKLISTSLEYQPGLAEMFMRMEKEDKSGFGPMKFVISIINQHKLIHIQPKLYAAAFTILYSLWQSVPDHFIINLNLRNDSKFWKSIEQLLSIPLFNQPQLQAYYDNLLQDSPSVNCSSISYFPSSLSSPFSSFFSLHCASFLSSLITSCLLLLQGSVYFPRVLLFKSRVGGLLFFPTLLLFSSPHCRSFSSPPPLLHYFIF